MRQPLPHLALPHLALAALALLITACGGGDEASAPRGDGAIAVMVTNDERLVIESGFARPVASGGNSAAYLVLRSDAADVVTGAASDAFDVVELHETSAADGAMRMRPVERIDLPAGTRVALEPGGRHLMLMNARRDLPEGGALPIVLQFGSGKSLAIELPVERR